MSDLELKRSSELIDELQRRFQHGMFILTRPDKKPCRVPGCRCKPMEVISGSWGSATEVIGQTAVWLKAKINQIARTVEEDGQMPEAF